jgi:hypothetical protein
MWAARPAAAPRRRWCWRRCSSPAAALETLRGSPGKIFFFYYFRNCLASVGKHMANVFAECPWFDTRQTKLCRVIFAVCGLPRVTLGEPFAEGRPGRSVPVV